MLWAQSVGQECVGGLARGRRERMSRIGEDALQVVGLAQERIDRPRGRQADANALDREVGIMQW